MDKGGASMDAWDWEVLPEHESFSGEGNAAHGHGGEVLADQENKEPILPPSEDPAGECKDVGVVVPAEPEPTREESMPSPKVTKLDREEEEEEEETFQRSDAKEVDDPHGQLAGEEEEAKKARTAAARPECVVFSVGKLRVNGIGALCSFGVAAATVCVFLAGGRLQHHQQKQQRQQIQLQFYGDDKRMQQVVQQTSRLNQAMSSVMGAGASTGANISFGGFYDGF